MAISYSRTQKKALVDSVRAASEKLGRPVSSKDLEAFWRETPSLRPLLLQRPGQLLLKAARPWKGNYPAVTQVGVIGKFAFYAPEPDPRWNAALDRHALYLRALDAGRLAVPEHAVLLLGSCHDSLARNALSGFLAEWGQVQGITLPKKLENQLAIAEDEKPWPFRGSVPPMISRIAAADIIARAAAADFRYCDGFTPSPHRHLSRLSWPQTSLLAGAGFWEFQVRAYCAALWPGDEDDAAQARCVWRCAGYGLPQS